MSETSKRVFGVSKSAGIRKSRRATRNSTRRNRRKRSKQRYYRELRNRRVKRHTDDLCTSLTVFDITDMEWTQSVPTSTEVADWQKQEQIAYWKSRALSLEYENRMLLEHIRDVYAKQTQDYSDNVKNEKRQIKNKKKDQVEEIEPLIEPEGKRKREEMEKLYGDMTARIMGMETVTQLNYDMHLKNSSDLQHWSPTPST